MNKRKVVSTGKHDVLVSIYKCAPSQSPPRGRRFPSLGYKRGSQTKRLLQIENSFPE